MRQFFFAGITARYALTVTKKFLVCSKFLKFATQQKGGRATGGLEKVDLLKRKLSSRSSESRLKSVLCDDLMSLKRV